MCPLFGPDKYRNRPPFVPFLFCHQARGGSRRNPTTHRRRTRRRNQPRGGGRSGGGGGGASSTEDDDDEEEAEEEEEGDDSDHDMEEFSPNGNDNTPQATNDPRYRLRENLLLKRARTGGGGGAAAGGGGGAEDGGGGYPDVPRVPLSEVVGVYSGGPSGRREGEAGHDPHTYGLFVDLVGRMLDQRPETR